MNPHPQHFGDSVFKHIFLKETFCILIDIQISLKFDPIGPIVAIDNM